MAKSTRSYHEGPGVYDVPDMRARIVLGVALAALLPLGCKPQLPAGWDSSGAQAFQARADRELGEAVSPLTAVDAFYFGGAPGQSAHLWLVPEPRDGSPPTRVVPSDPERNPDVPEPDPDLGVRFSLEGGRLWCERGCGEGRTRLEETGEVGLAPFVLAVGVQPGAGGRVVVHDPRRRAVSLDGRWFPVDPRFIVPARLIRDGAGTAVHLATSRGLAKPFVRVGELHFELPAGSGSPSDGGGVPAHLVAFASEAAPDAPWLVPFTDLSNGDSTYPVGRYLSVEPPRDGEDAVALDFNRATNPWCAYAEHYNCPVPPAQNRLGSAVSAGERDWSPH